jgi:4-amino-4-deoxy-L-arabinose transferase-like glycosyltransferase
MNEGAGLSTARVGGDKRAMRRLWVPSVLLILLHVFFMAYRVGQLPIVPAIPDEVVINDPAIALSRGQGLVATSFADSKYGLDHVYAHFPPLYPYTEAVAFRVFGVSSASLRLTTVLMSILSTVALLLVLLRLCRAGLMHWSMALFVEALYCTNPSLVALERMARMESMIGFLLLVGLWGIVLAMTRRAGASGLAPMLLAGLCGALCVAVHPEAMTAMLLLGGLMLYAVPVGRRVRWISVGLFVVVPPVIGLLTFRSQLVAAVRQFLAIAHDATKTNTSSLEFFTKVLPNHDLSRLNRTVFFLTILLMMVAAPVVWATVSRRLAKTDLRYRLGVCLAVVSVMELLLMVFALRMDDRRCQFLFGALLVCTALTVWGAKPLRRWQVWVGVGIVVVQCCGAAYYLSPRSDRVADMDPDRYMALVRQLPAGMSVATTPGLWLDMQEERRPFTLILYGLDGETNWRTEGKNPFDRFDIVILEDYYTVGKPWWRADAEPGRTMQRVKIGRDTVDIYMRHN